MKHTFSIVLFALLLTSLSCTNQVAKEVANSLILEPQNTSPSEMIYSDSLIRDTNNTSEPMDDSFFILVEIDKRDTCDAITFVPSQQPHEADTLIVNIKQDHQPLPAKLHRMKVLVPVQVQSLDLNKKIVLKVVKPTKKRTGSTKYSNARNDKDNYLDNLNKLSTVCIFNCDNPLFSGCEDLLTDGVNYWLELSQISTYTYQDVISQNEDIEIIITEDPEGDRNGCCMIPVPSPNTDPTISLTVKPSNRKTRKGTAKYSNASTPILFPCD